MGAHFPRPSEGPLSLLLTYACYHHSLSFFEPLPPTQIVQPLTTPNGSINTHLGALASCQALCHRPSERQGWTMPSQLPRGSQSHRGRGQMYALGSKLLDKAGHMLSCVGSWRTGTVFVLMSSSPEQTSFCYTNEREGAKMSKQERWMDGWVDRWVDRWVGG